MMSRNEIPEINAGSMADIAFLLLIFFLVATTMDTEAGIPRKLPPKTNDIPITLKERNVLTIDINRNGDILIEAKHYVHLHEVKTQVMDYLDNGASLGKDGLPCDYCEGKKLNTSSMHPNKAVISLGSSRKTKYGDYIAVTNEIVRAYNELRDRESKKLYKISYKELLERAKKNPRNKTLRAKVETVKKRFPMLFSEAEPIKIEEEKNK